MAETVDEAVERGRREGRVDATLDDHSKHLTRINGNIERFAKSVEGLEKTVRSGLEAVHAEIRTVQEERRLDQERVAAAAKALAEETERRRKEAEEQRVERADALAVAPRKWGLRSSKANVVYAVLALVGLLVTVYFGMQAAAPPAAPTVTVTTTSVAPGR